MVSRRTQSFIYEFCVFHYKLTTIKRAISNNSGRSEMLISVYIKTITFQIGVWWLLFLFWIKMNLIN